MDRRSFYYLTMFVGALLAGLGIYFISHPNASPQELFDIQVVVEDTIVTLDCKKQGAVFQAPLDYHPFDSLIKTGNCASARAALFLRSFLATISADTCSIISHNENRR